MLDRLPGPIRRWLYAGGTRQDRLRDPDAVVRALNVRPGMIVGDLGPGAGHFTLGSPARLSRTASSMRSTRASARSTTWCAPPTIARITTLRAVRVPRDRLEVPEPVDLLFVSATYHHLPDRSTYFADARTHLRPGATRGDPRVTSRGIAGSVAGPSTRRRRAEVLREMTDAGYRLIATHDVVYGYWFGIFEVADPSGEDGLARLDFRPVGSTISEQPHRSAGNREGPP